MSVLLAVLGTLLFVGVIVLKIFVFNRLGVKWVVGLAATGLVCIGLSGAFFYAEPGYSYMVQYPWGTQVGITKPGYNLRWWGDKLPIKRVITVRLTNAVDKDSETASKMDNAVKVLFNDGVRAKISASTRFEMPTSPEKLVKLMRDYRTQENLVNSSLVPVTREVIRNTARELSAQSYISGGGGVLESNILDQMERGVVMLDVKEEVKLEEEEALGQSGEREIKNRKVVISKVVRRVGKDGLPLRKGHPIIQYDIKIPQSTVEDVDFEPKFKQMIGQQRDATARASIEKQKAKEAEFAKTRIIAEGEKQKAKEKAEQEKAQVTILIQAETQMKKEEWARQQAEIALQKEELRAKSITVIAKAEADARRLKMQADGALEQKLAAWVEAQKAWATSTSAHKLVPDTVVGGSSNGQNSSATQFIDILMANQAQQLSLQSIE